MLIDNPLHDAETRLAVLNGYVKHQSKVIENLRQQIMALRCIAQQTMTNIEIDVIQYAPRK
jgi:uncharacterized coiled-coil protein SlyX